MKNQQPLEQNRQRDFSPYKYHKLFGKYLGMGLEARIADPDYAIKLIGPGLELTEAELYGGYENHGHAVGGLIRRLDLRSRPDAHITGLTQVFHPVALPRVDLVNPKTPSATIRFLSIVDTLDFKNWHIQFRCVYQSIGEGQCYPIRFASFGEADTFGFEPRQVESYVTLKFLRYNREFKPLYIKVRFENGFFAYFRMTHDNGVAPEGVVASFRIDTVQESQVPCRLQEFRFQPLEESVNVNRVLL